MGLIDPKPLYHKYRPFIRKKQLRKLLLVTLLRWLMTAAIVGAIYGVLVAYSNREAMRKHKKREFSAIIVALSIALSLNLMSSLRSMAGELRWWLLSLREWPIIEADLILQCEHLSHVVKLAFASKLWAVRLAAVCWVLINLAAQAAIATLSLTWTVEAADTVTVTRPGMVSIPDMSNIQTNKVLSSTSQALSALRYTANSYGLTSLAYVWGTLDEIPKPGTIFDPDEPLIFCGVDLCTYLFYEATVNEGRNYMSVATNRTVTTKAECSSWPVIEGGDGRKSSIVIDDDKKTNVTIPAINGDSQTTFMANIDAGLGPDWSYIAAFEASSTDPWFYNCQVTVGPVVNAVLPEHELGANVSSLAASAIALQGYGASQLATAEDTTQQFQSYPAESTFGEPQGGSTNGMAALLASFATGVVAVTAQSNANLHARGLKPLRGVHLHIDDGWTDVTVVLCVILGAQLLLGLLAALLANTVVVRAHSYLGMAHLLRPVSQKLSYYRCHGVHEKESETLHGPEPTLRYRQSRVGDYSFETDCEVDPI